MLQGRDVLGIAQTGTGKTAAFALPILQRLTSDQGRASPRAPRALILAPTRELAAQICASFRMYGRYLPLVTSVVFGGASQNMQVRELNRGVDILVATPGRLLDLAQRDFVRFDKVEMFVLDEVDRMLDMGFIGDIRKILGDLPRQRQTLMFSATLPPDIERLARTILTAPLVVSIAPMPSTALRISQSVHFVEQAEKRTLLSALLQGEDMVRTLVFTRTKRGADRVVRHLHQDGIEAEVIHGDKSQSDRERALQNFRTGQTKVLIATDIAARGIDVTAISHVINYDIPNAPESYVHRIGRTARAGTDGTAISFCAVDERPHLRSIERLIGQYVPVSGEARRDAAPVPVPALAGLPPNSAWRKRMR